MVLIIFSFPHLSTEAEITDSKTENRQVLDSIGTQEVLLIFLVNVVLGYLYHFSTSLCT